MCAGGLWLKAHTKKINTEVVKLSEKEIRELIREFMMYVVSFAKENIEDFTKFVEEKRKTNNTEVC